MKKHTVLIAAITALAASLATSPAVAQGRGGRGGNPDAAQAPAATATANPATPRIPLPDEKTSVTQHEIKMGGVTIPYTATAATYNIKSADGTVKAQMYFVAYIKNGVPNAAKRPLSFIYNGGPGSSSLFTHMGLGPKRIALTDDGHGMAAPYSIVDNESTFLDATDMVFIDAIGTGYSRPAPGEATSQFYGVTQDATYFADFIYQYINRNERWASPKYLIGESYGTTRSAVLSNILQQRHQIYLNGVALLSSVGFGNFGADDRTRFFLPTMITSAWFHKLLPPDLQKLTIEQIAQKAREFAHGEYAQALEKGDTLTPAEYQHIVTEIARYTGLKPKYIEQTNLRPSPQRWFKEILRDKRQTVGRLDARFTGMDYDAAGERNEYDSSEASYEGAYVAMFHDYTRRELKWSTDAYQVVTGNVRPWDNGQPGQPAEALRSAMTEQGTMKLLVICGYYDHATPFNGIEFTVQHMALEPSVRKNVTFTYYEAGHMMYVDKKAREKLHTDVNAFINGAYRP